MNGDLDDGNKLGTARDTLAQLDKQAQGLRAELLHLRRDLTQAQQALNATQAAALLEANEQLVLAALRAETIAETAVSDLGELARSSQRDALTDTPNRALMLDRIEIAITRARRNDTRIAVLFLDLDDFKLINDTLGHAVGDGALQLVARRLESAVRDSDTVSRHSGDEFLVLLADVSQPSDAALIGQKMLAAVTEPALVCGQPLSLSASVGVALYPDDGADAETLIAKADAAMYRAKRRGSGGLEIHRPQRTPGERNRDVDELSQRLTARSGRESEVRTLREANEQLVIAAMTTQELEARALEAHQQHVKFVAMVAHEMRNPLSPIRTAAELLKHAGSDEALLARLQVMIKRQVAHMTRLVDDLLDGARVGSGKFRLERGPVEMSGVFALAVETCRGAMDSRHQRLTMQLPAGPLTVMGDVVRLAQIFTNLLDNASKYTPKGGQIELAVAVQAGTLVVSVSDNGIGITAAALPHIFDLFVRDTRAQALDRRGLGIGLAVVRELVEAHGGTVVATSAGTDLGSRFVVTLPLTGAEDA